MLLSLRPTSGSSLPEKAAVAALVPLAAAVGVALAMASSRFGAAAPVAMVAAVALPALALAILADPRVAVAVVIAVVPVGTLDLPGAPVQLVLAAVVACAVLVGLRRVRESTAPIGWSAPLGWGVALLGWCVVALPSAADHTLAIRQLIQLAVGLLFAMLVASACRTYEGVRRALYPGVVIAAVVCLYSATSTDSLQSSFRAAVVTGRAQGTFTQPNELGMYAAAMGVVAISFALAARTARGKAFWAGMSLAILVGLALSLSRGAWIGFLAGLMALVILLPEARRLLVALVVVAAPFGLVLGAYVPSNPQVEVIGERIRSIAGERNPYDDRPAIWSEAQREVVADPFTGQGPGSFPVASVRSTSETRSTYAVHAHNLLLTWAAETGLPGALCIVALAVHVGAMVRRARARVRRDGEPRDAVVLAGLTAAMVAVLGQGIVDYPLRNSSLFVLTWGLLGALLAAASAGRRQAATAS